MIGMAWRLAIFAFVTITSLWILNSLDPPSPELPHGVFRVGEMNVLGHTWYGPALLMLIPASLCWVGFGAETPRAARFFIAASLTLAVICLLIIRGASRAGIFT